jgi:hypothetical protein
MGSGGAAKLGVARPARISGGNNKDFTATMMVLSFPLREQRAAGKPPAWTGTCSRPDAIRATNK